ncbi:MAG: O-methyltransferase [Candidatus Aenigmatarchaeota archaeon]
MKDFEKKFDVVAQDLEKLTKEWVIEGIPKGHEKIWTPKNEVRLWSVPRSTAEFLKFLVVSSKSKTILELGTAAGYSTIWLAWGAKINGGKVYTMELFEPKIKMAAENFKKTGLEDSIVQIHGEIDKELDKWDKEIDFIFMDADKHNYLKYVKKLLPYLKKNGIIVADNAVDYADLMKDFLEFVENNSDLESILLKIDNGLLLAIKK